MSVDKAITISTKGLTFDIIRRSGLFPTIGILNSFFQCGIDDVDSEVTLQWWPFALDAREYGELYEACRKSIGQLEIDGLGFDHYTDWFESVAERNANT